MNSKNNNTKYIILLGDGMADHPLDELAGKTPLEAAKTDNMDFMAKEGTTGYVKTVPEGFPAGSDVANLTIFGYDPEKYYTGRAPLEAANIGVTLSETDIAYRCNFVTISETNNNPVMDDFSAGHITDKESFILIDFLNEKFPASKIKFYPGKSYRHLMVWNKGSNNISCTPPHDISGKAIDTFLPHGEKSDFLLELMNKSRDILSSHPINSDRVKRGLKPANSIWLWGQGKSTKLPLFKTKFGVDGAVISAVDLLKGIGKLAGLKIINVPGVTGYLDTNYKGKVEYAIKELKSSDFVYLHVEAPDEAGHEGNIEKKIQAIEDFDSLIVGKILNKITQFEDFRLLLLCDHPTPVKLMTHTSDNVPYAIYPGKNTGFINKFNEYITKVGEINFDKGFKLINYFLDKP